VGNPIIRLSDILFYIQQVKVPQEIMIIQLEWWFEIILIEYSALQH